MQGTFPFLDLPKDVRLLVYEQMDLGCRHLHDKIHLPINDTIATVTFVTPLAKPMQSPVHLTCKLIREEALHVQRREFYRVPDHRPVARIIVPAAHAMALAKVDGFIDTLCRDIVRVGVREQTRDPEAHYDSYFRNFGLDLEVKYDTPERHECEILAHFCNWAGQQLKEYLVRIGELLEQNHCH